MWAIRARNRGAGGYGGDVWVQSDSTVETKGDTSLGILAQSVGGGGGKGGSTIDAGISAGLGVTLGSASGGVATRAPWS